MFLRTSNAKPAATEPAGTAAHSAAGRERVAAGFRTIMARLRREDRIGLEWSRRRDAVRLILTGATWSTASRVAAVVGTLLTVVNQAGAIVGGEATAMTTVRIVFNYLIPDAVASIGFLAPFRVEERRAR